MVLCISERVTQMSKKKTIKPHSAAQQKQYEREARLQYGAATVNESIQRWNSYSKNQQQDILAQGGEIYQAMVNAMTEELPITSTEVQQIVERWHQHLRNFYEPTLDILRGLGEMYHENPDFAAFFQQFHPNMTAYMRDAIVQYVDDLETAELESMLLAEAEGRLSN